MSPSVGRQAHVAETRSQQPRPRARATALISATYVLVSPPQHTTPVLRAIYHIFLILVGTSPSLAAGLELPGYTMMGRA